MSEIQNPHDQFVRATLSDKVMAKSFLENYLPSEIVKKLNLSKLEVSQESFVDEDLQEHHTDLLYQVATKTGEKAFVYVLFEHKSSPEKLVAFQLLRYMIRIWEKYKTSSKFPNIVPLVLYHGKRKWNVSHEFASLVEFSNDEIYAKSTPNFEYFICDLSKFDENELKGEIALRITLLILKHIFSPNLKHKLPGILQLFTEINEKGVVELLSKLLRYLSASSDKISRKEVKTAMRTAFKTEKTPKEYVFELFKEMVDEGYFEEDYLKKIQDKIVQKEIKRKIVQYQQQGMQQGMQQSLVNTIFRQISKRFGEVSNSTKNQIGELSIAQLEKLSEDLLDFTQLADFDSWILKNSN